MYRYIGNKQKLLPFVLSEIQKMTPRGGVVFDIMAGTGAVSRALRTSGFSVVASDVMTYSFHHLQSSLLIGEAPTFDELSLTSNISAPSRYSRTLSFLNQLPPVEGYFFREFSPSGVPEEDVPPRSYFTPENASRIDAIRLQLKKWEDSKLLSDLEVSLLKHDLIMAANRVANISGTYGYFLKSFKASSIQALELRPSTFEQGNLNHIVRQGFAEDLCSEYDADVCYVDPPYIKRQYAANYHILETLARGDEPHAVGKSGLRDWWDQHSVFCTKTRGLAAFRHLMSNSKASTLIISYSSEGLFHRDELHSLFSSFGEVTFRSLKYPRFRSNANSGNSFVDEYLFTVVK